MHLTVGIRQVNPGKEIWRDLVRRTPFQSESERTIPTRPFRNWVESAKKKQGTLPKPKGFKWAQLGERIALRPLTLRARVKSDRNAQIARWSVGYFWPAKLDSGNIPQKSKYKIVHGT